MAEIGLDILSDGELRDIHEASIRILSETGVLVPDPEVFALLLGAGAKGQSAHPIARLPESLVMDLVRRAGHRYTLHGRDPQREVRYGDGGLTLLSTPGQRAWVDERTGRLRPATVADARKAIRLGDALPHVSIVGAMAQPAELNDQHLDVVLTAELVKGTTKPTRAWVRNRRAAAGVLEVYRALAGGAAALAQRPMAEGFLTVISPLQFPRDGLEVVREFVQAGQPVCVASMPMTAATAPATLAGTLALANAEVLAGIVITQLLKPGTPILYGGVPHVMDLRSGHCSFGSPEQALMAVAMTQIGHFYRFPVYINVGLTDAKTLDAQAGSEKAMTLALGALAGAELFGHAGICGADQGASLLWLAADNELMGWIKHVVRRFEVSPETLAVEVVQAVKAGGNFLACRHTAAHFRDELWFPAVAWNRQNYADWESGGRTTMAERLAGEVQRVLSSPQPSPLDPALAREIDRIVSSTLALSQA
jgi:trimethylamine--corrinoid protein Co-methyltransferase